MKAILIKETGGPEKMTYEDMEIPACGASDVLVRIGAAGVNFIDTYQRSGLYPVNLPHVLGMEGAGIVENVGTRVTDFSIGEHVAFTGIPGAYAEYVKVPESRLVKLPTGVSLREGAAAMLQGCTAHYLTHSTYPLQKGDRCLIHAAAGGMGLLMLQMAKMAGAYTIGTVSTEEKAAKAKAAGADEVILYTQTDFEKEVSRLTDGQGVHVVYDSIGKTTCSKSLNCLRPRGYLVLYGNSSGPVTEFNPVHLQAKGSLFLTRPSLNDYIATGKTWNNEPMRLFTWIKEKKLNLAINHVFPLSEAKNAHIDLEGRKTTGKILLVP